MSSGGFSPVFSTPLYQSPAVSGWVFLGSTYIGLYSTFERGFPDLSAASKELPTVFNGIATTANGTGCSTPLVASIVILLNDELAGTKTSPLGFLKPLIYVIKAYHRRRVVSIRSVEVEQMTVAGYRLQPRLQNERLQRRTWEESGTHLLAIQVLDYGALSPSVQVTGGFTTSQGPLLGSDDD
ncbi:hypothetical protein DENSPDRAFT_347246 [Dentipellis sp. KUC8613]|nr:hypothetical protein DENSPDRAFT_347246 [Dentipellis sp. KUC8613]